jgi:predicted permease
LLGTFLYFQPSLQSKAFGKFPLADSRDSFIFRRITVKRKEAFLLENFIFSVNATLPVFLVIVVGYVLKQIGLVDSHFTNVLNRFNFHVSLPVMLFRDIMNSDIRKTFDLKYILFCVFATTVCFWALWGLSKKFICQKESVGAFVQASFRGSAAVLGAAFIQNMYGTSGMAPLMIIGCVPLYNIYSVIVLSAESNGKKEKSLKNTALEIAKNPIIIGILAGLLVSASGIRLPVILDKTVSSIASTATPMALIVIGAAFEGKKAVSKIKLTGIASVIKLLIQPAIFLPLAVLAGFRDQHLIALLVMLGAPTTVSCYIMAKNMENDEYLTSSVIVVTTLFSSVTMTFWIYLLKSFSFIS